MDENRSLVPVKSRLQNLSRMRFRGQEGEEKTPASPEPEGALPPARMQGPAQRVAGSPEPSRDLGDGRDSTPQSLFDLARKQILPIIEKRISPEEARTSSRGILARRVTLVLNEWLSATGQELNMIDQRNLVTYLINQVAERSGANKQGQVAHPSHATTPAQQQKTAPTAGTAPGSTVTNARTRIQSILMNRIDTVAAASLPKNELVDQLQEVIGEILVEQQLRLNRQEKDELIELLLNDMLGLGPLEPLMKDNDITDIMINGPQQVYIERKGKLSVSGVTFRDNAHLLNICQRIVSQVGRRIDESQPMVDARLLDGSRVNIIIPPLALDGPTMSIRRFGNRNITLAMMAEQGNLSPAMAKLLEIAGACRLNIIVSGGTGAGKTTLLNALSQMIDPGERVITVEDSAELRLQQPHVVRLETRPANLEGEGEITIRDLIKNALRMRPDRIIVGECRSAEIIDMLQAMKTGHDGSMSTVHANNPRTCLTRIENMLNMAGFHMPEKVVRSMLSSAIELIVQIQRMRDGKRRITHIMEIVGMEDTTILTQDLFWWEFREETPDGQLIGEYVTSGLRPHFTKKAAYFNRDQELIDVMRVL